MSTFRLPDLGEGLAEAEIVEWHVKVGDHVRVDQPMVSVETAKAVVEVPAPFSGVVTALRGGPGDIVLTGAALIEFDSGTVVGSMPSTSEEEYEESGSVPAARSGGGDSSRARAVPAARSLAKRLGVDLAAVQGGGRAGLITLDDVLQHANMPVAIRRRARLAGRARDCGGRTRRRHRRTAARRAARDGAKHVAVAGSGAGQHGVRRRRYSSLEAGAATTCCG